MPCMFVPEMKAAGKGIFAGTGTIGFTTPAGYPASARAKGGATPATAVPPSAAINSRLAMSIAVSTPTEIMPAAMWEKDITHRVGGL